MQQIKGENAWIVGEAVHNTMDCEFMEKGAEAVKLRLR
jgi:hypothetical protein